MKENNKRGLCYRIIILVATIFDVDVTTLPDKTILLILKKLEILSYEKLSDIENTLYIIYYGQFHKEEE